MTGWRVGYACGDAELISALASLTSQSTTSVAEPSQYGAIAAYNMHPKHTETYRKHLCYRRDNAFQQIESIPYMTCTNRKVPFTCSRTFKNVQSSAATTQSMLSLKTSSVKNMSLLFRVQALGHRNMHESATLQTRLHLTKLLDVLKTLLKKKLTHKDEFIYENFY